MPDSASSGTEEQQTLALLVRDQAGALERVLGVLRRRAPEFSTVNVATTDEPGIVSVTISVTSAPAVAERAATHLSKLVDVIWVTSTPATASESNMLLSELALIRVACDEQTRREVVDVAHLFAAKPVEVTDTSVTLEASGSHETIENLLRLLRPLGIRKLTRSGGVAMRRGDSQLDERKEASRATG